MPLSFMEGHIGKVLLVMPSKILAVGLWVVLIAVPRLAVSRAWAKRRQRIVEIGHALAQALYALADPSQRNSLIEQRELGRSVDQHVETVDQRAAGWGRIVGAQRERGRRDAVKRSACSVEGVGADLATLESEVDREQGLTRDRGEAFGCVRRCQLGHGIRDAEDAHAPANSARTTRRSSLPVSL